MAEMQDILCRAQVLDHVQILEQRESVGADLPSIAQPTTPISHWL